MASPKKRWPEPPKESLEYQGLTFTVVLLDPELAEEWMERNEHNRHLSASTEGSYARDMTNGEWAWLGDPIRFSRSGRLIDGQHRVQSVIDSKVTVPVLLVEGFTDESQQVMDSGKMRSWTDVLSLRGEEDPVQLAAVVRRLILWERNQVGGFGLKLTKPELLAFIQAHPEVRRAAEVAVGVKNARLPVAPSVIGTAYFLCARVDKADADHFFVEQLTEGLGLENDDIVRVLLRKFRIEQKPEVNRNIDPELALRYTLLAWNHFRRGTTTTRLLMPKGGWPAYKDTRID